MHPIGESSSWTMMPRSPHAVYFPPALSLHRITSQHLAQFSSIATLLQASSYHTTSLYTKPLPPHHFTKHFSSHQITPYFHLNSTPSPSHYITLHQAPPTTSLHTKPLPPHHFTPGPSHHITPLHPFRPSPIATEQWGSLPVHCPFLWQ